MLQDQFSEIAERKMSDAESSESDIEMSEDDSELEVQNDSDSEDDIPELNVQPWMSVFAPESARLDQDRFVQEVGVRDMPAANSRPIDYFFLLFTLDFLRQIVAETNRYKINA